MSHCAHGVIIKKGEETISVLLVLEDKKWGLPGGTQEGNESPEETLMRELREEITVEATPGNLIYQKTEYDHLKNPQYIRCVYFVDITEEQLWHPKRLSKPNPPVVFFKLECLPRRIRRRHRDVLHHLFKKEYRKLSQKKNKAPIRRGLLFTLNITWVSST